MYIYLSQKIAIPKETPLRCVDWNVEEGYIACGGENGLLKVLKMESSREEGARTHGLTARLLRKNQTLDQHRDATVTQVRWNHNCTKLASSDDSGLIIVFMFDEQADEWVEEMENPNSETVVADMQWTPDGRRICIAYENGSVIVGSVDGNRLWGKSLDMPLVGVQWSPDTRQIFFANADREVMVYDSAGEQLAQVDLVALEGSDDAGTAAIISMDWYDGRFGAADARAPTLAIAFSNGRVQLCRGANDPAPEVIDTGTALACARWNTDGTVLALAGSRRGTSEDERRSSEVQFYSPWGEHLHTLKVSTPRVDSLAWEGGGLRIALAAGPFIYFANLRPDYKWAYFGGTLAYSYVRPNRSQTCIAFWDTRTDTRVVKYAHHLEQMASAKSHCVLATRALEGDHYIVSLRNALGTPIEEKHVDVHPAHVAMAATHVAVASSSHVYVWQHSAASSVATSALMKTLKRRVGREILFHIDSEPPSAATGGQFATAEARGFSADALKKGIESADPVCSLAMTNHALFLARESGALQRYSLPMLAKEAEFMTGCRPQMIRPNCDGTRLLVADMHGALAMFDGRPDDDVEAGKEVDGPARRMEFHRKDVWDLRWAEDDAEQFATMEKTRMYMFRGTEPEEPVLSSAYLCQFKDLSVTSAQIDEILQQPDTPQTSLITTVDVRSVRDARDIFKAEDLGNSALRFAEQHPHPRILHMLSEEALKRLDLGTAESAFVLAKDYSGIQFVKRLRGLDGKQKRLAEVMAYLEDFDGAESIYREMERRDLSVKMRMKLGDWFRVLQLLQAEEGDDELTLTTYNKIGDYWAARSVWRNAAQFYEKAGNREALAGVYYQLEAYDKLTALSRKDGLSSPLLLDIAKKLQSVGMSEPAVDCYLRMGDVKAAIDCCVQLQQWDSAIQLAQEHNFPQIHGLFSKYANHLLQRGSVEAEVDAVRLYRKAGKSTEAASLLAKLARRTQEQGGPPQRVKKLLVLAAREMEAFQARVLNQTASTLEGTSTTGGGGSTGAQQTLNSLMTHDLAVGSDKSLRNPWHAAAAYHFLMLAHRQLYAKDYGAAMNTAFALKVYDDVLEPRDVYTLQALSSFFNRHYKKASRAFMSLEADEGMPAETRGVLKRVAMSIFTRHQPVDPPDYDEDSAWMLDKVDSSVRACVVSGRPIFQSTRGVVRCRTCRARAYEEELLAAHLHHCPLCHNTVDYR